MWPVITGGLLVILATILHHSKQLNHSLGEGFQTTMINIPILGNISEFNSKDSSIYSVGDILTKDNVVNILTDVPSFGELSGITTIGADGNKLSFLTPVFNPPNTTYKPGNYVYYKGVVYILITAPRIYMPLATDTPLKSQKNVIWASIYNKKATYSSEDAGKVVINIENKTTTLNNISINKAGIIRLNRLAMKIPPATSSTAPSGANSYANISSSLTDNDIKTYMTIQAKKAAAKATTVYLIDNGDVRAYPMNGPPYTEIVVTLTKGQRGATWTGLRTTIGNIISIGDSLNWTSPNGPKSAKIIHVRVDYSNYSSEITEAIYIQLDEPVDIVEKYYVIPNQEIRMSIQADKDAVTPTSPATIQGFQSYGNPYISSPADAQALEFRLGQNGWLM